jgi:hypothetical protein
VQLVANGAGVAVEVGLGRFDGLPDVGLRMEVRAAAIGFC